MKSETTSNVLTVGEQEKRETGKGSARCNVICQSFRKQAKPIGCAFGVLCNLIPALECSVRVSLGQRL